MPGTIGGNGTLAHPVAHVKHTYDVNEPIAPCFQGVDRRVLEDATDHPAIDEWKRMIWADDALWEL